MTEYYYSFTAKDMESAERFIELNKLTKKDIEMIVVIWKE